MDTPANLMTPTVFAERAQKEFNGVEGITVNVYDEGRLRPSIQTIHTPTELC